jgi:putative endonuclease
VSPGATGRPSDADPPDPSVRADPIAGRDGGAPVALWYEDRGYEVLERNWRRREGEVDLIVRKGRTVAFCEVLTQADGRSGTGADLVLEARQRRIRRLASRWLSELTPAAGRARVEIRFDVATITTGHAEVMEDAF